MDTLEQIFFYFNTFGGLAQFLVLLFIGFIVGSIIERRHYRSIVEREEQLKDLPTVSFGKNAKSKRQVKDVRLVVGMCSISTDFFKRTIASIINIFGGNIRTYESLVDRARREALLRMRAQAKGASMIVNVRVENSNLFVSSSKGLTIGSVEVMAYGTAIILED